MTRLLGLLMLVALVSATPVAAQDAEKEDGFDAKKMVGKWNYAKGVRGGEDSALERLQGTITITEDELKIPAGPNEEFVMGYEIDADKDPVAIDIVIKEGPVQDAQALGIIKMEDGKITLCYDPNGQKRPEKFESTADNGFFLFVLKPQDD